jgi:hypothetical protein
MARTLLTFLVGVAILTRGVAAGQEGPSVGESTRPALDASGVYPVTVAPVESSGYSVEYGRLPDGTACLTVIGRAILWWRTPDLKADIVRHLELQADNVVVLLSGQTQDANQPSGQRMLGQGLALDQIKAIYLEGNVLFAEDDRSIRCDQIYYDPQGHRALALRAVLRTFSPERGVPLYVRAGRLRQESEDVFSGDDVVLTTSEFYVPQLSFSAVHMHLRDSTGLDAAKGEL